MQLSPWRATSDGDDAAARTRTDAASRIRAMTRYAMRLLVLDTWRDPLSACSSARPPPPDTPSIDFTKLMVPLRAFVWLTLCPLLCYPVASVYAYGYYRCLRTTLRPSAYVTAAEATTASSSHHVDGDAHAPLPPSLLLVTPKSHAELRLLPPSSSSHQQRQRVHYCVQRRRYWPLQRRVSESPVRDLGEMSHALNVVGGEFSRFIDDPAQPSVAYHVVEQPCVELSLSKRHGLAWTLGVVADAYCYALPVWCAHRFRPASRRLWVDLRLCYEGRLRLSQLRHPIPHFFTTAGDYHRSIHRVNVTQPGAWRVRPWNYRL